MTERAKRTWWPFDVIPATKRDAEHNAGIDFFNKAAQLGFRAYMEGSDLGAMADDGKACRIIWRGSQRRELLFIDGEQCVAKRMFTSADRGAALAQAATAALDFLQGGPLGCRTSAANISPIPEVAPRH